MAEPLKRLTFIGQLGAPGRYDPALFADEPGGDDETVWFEATLRRAGVRESVRYEGRRVCHGAPLPPIDGPDAPEVVVVGGSFHSVHDDLPWQRALTDWLRAQRARGDAGPIVLGICGGHQIMARALGAPVAKVTGGTVAATLPVDLTAAGAAHPLFRDLPRPPRFHFGNEEHVVQPPEGATILATRAEMPAVALDFGGGWYSVQFHPEAEAAPFARSWGRDALHYANNYVEVPETARLIRNFLDLERRPR
ncbi:type 1 glutamine amidotransferase [Marivibrio halodurans]|uniref:Type 1 glutamine amidotransferase n=1 Tax=Marivibrio halodurans TaxID=2039722 RepID=A0A8J7S402_9PROT|nr:type 1 glutamine amidotransferase [Marivibrio halodurans]MBP5856329.1 type 1 glutamine amidotransferase [Marivibrio halodurans]